MSASLLASSTKARPSACLNICARWMSCASLTWRTYEVYRRVPRPSGGRTLRRGDPAHHDTTMDADGDLRRANTRDCEVRARRTAATGDYAGAWPWLPGLRHAGRADRQGGGDCRAPRSDLLLLRRYAACARDSARPPGGQGGWRRCADRLLAAGRTEARPRESRDAGGV